MPAVSSTPVCGSSNVNEVITGLQLIYDGFRIADVWRFGSGGGFVPGERYFWDPLPPGVSPLGDALTISFDDHSISFELPAGSYSNAFSLLVETAIVPLPGAAWLLLSGLGALSAGNRLLTRFNQKR